jgi:hypothetical protein
MTYLVRVDSGFACFGFVVAGGRVVRSAPITKWAIGRLGRDVVAYWRNRGATVTWIGVAA